MDNLNGHFYLKKKLKIVRNKSEKIGAVPTTRQFVRIPELWRKVTKKNGRFSPQKLYRTIKKMLRNKLIIRRDRHGPSSGPRAAKI